ncbi:hypothetical protein [Streptomyces shaanxiensis]|uniref:Uncharacterized protein n=1 Tax=Streptomyces shaanxiensis TaxID=653357 RepID=A0ABP7V3R0_9ACTN
MPITVGEAARGGIGRSAEGRVADSGLMAEVRARARGRGWWRILTTDIWSTRCSAASSPSASSAE